MITYFDLVRFFSLEEGISYLIHSNLTLLVLPIEGSSKRSFRLKYLQTLKAKQRVDVQSLMKNFDVGLLLSW